MSHSVRDHAGLPAAGSRKNQQRTFHVFHGSALFRIQALKKVHYEEVDERIQTRRVPRRPIIVVYHRRSSAQAALDRCARSKLQPR